MECRSIRERLSSYLEGIVSSEEKKAIEEHLPSCQACSVALKDLKRTEELVRGLKEVEPPPWMTQKVLARIKREQEAKKSIFEKLFFPLRIKLPLQATATVLIAVLAIYVFKAGEPGLKKAQPPAVTDTVTSKGEVPKQPSPPAAEVRELEAERAPEEMPKPPEKQEVGRALEAKGRKDVAPLVSEKMKGIPESERRGANERQEGAPVTTVGKPASSAPPPEAAGGRKKEGVESKLDETVISLGSAERDAAKQRRIPAAGAVKTEEFPPAKDTPSKELKAPAAAAPPRAMLAKRAGGVSITVQVRDVKVAGGEIEDLLHRLGATGVEKETIQDAEVITAGLQPEKIEELIEKLKLKGDIKEKELPSQFSERETRIRVEILGAR